MDRSRRPGALPLAMPLPSIVLMVRVVLVANRLCKRQSKKRQRCKVNRQRVSKNGTWARRCLGYPAKRATRRQRLSNLSTTHCTASMHRPTKMLRASEEAGHQFTQLVGDVDVKFSSGEQESVPLSEVARDNGLFLAAKPRIDLRRREMLAALALVECTVAALRHARGQDWSETMLGNLEHLLLVIQQRLVHALEQADVCNWWGHERRAVLARSWFSEFPGSLRPTSTTWPWTIRPALAVLWGVCWMFYAEAQAHGARVRATRIEPRLGWQGPTDGAYLQYGQQALGTALDDGRGRNSNDATTKTNRRAGREATSMHHVGGPAPQHQVVDMQSSRSLSFSPGADAEGQKHHLQAQAQQALDQAPYRTRSDSSRCQYLVPELSAPALVPSTDAHHLYTDALPSALAHHSQLVWPEVPGIQQHDILDPLTSLTVPAITFDDYSDILQPTSARPSAPPSSLSPSPSPSPVPPPHSADDYISAFAANATNHFRYSSNNFATNYPGPMDVFYPQPNLGLNLPPHTIPGARPMSPPDSVSETLPVMEQPSRKRKYSDVAAQLTAASSTAQERPSSEDRDPGYTPRGKYSHKRAVDPPKNALGKMICTFSSECAGITFDRKCEWSKHMDKHDRPYVCRHKGCEKLQGFTYSGGLLRHEREVHKMHGGTKKALFCPHQDCKRSMGTGFTRKENLAEHIRRVHRHASGDVADPAPAVMAAHEDPDEGASPDAEAEPDSPYAMTSRPTRRASGKRRRASISSQFGMPGQGGGGAEMENEDLRQEIRRLQQENEEKDERLRKLEEAFAALTRGQAGQASVPV